jgi:hypothetical protein
VVFKMGVSNPSDCFAAWTEYDTRALCNWLGIGCGMRTGHVTLGLPCRPHPCHAQDAATGGLEL